MVSEKPGPCPLIPTRLGSLYRVPLGTRESEAPRKKSFFLRVDRL